MTGGGGLPGIPPGRQRAMLAGIAGATALAVFMLVFLFVDWYRTVPVVGAAGAETVFAQYLIAGEWIDYLLGTNVFWIASTWRALATGILIGIAAPMVGVFLIHRQMALIGETLAHTAFAGVAIGVVVVALVGWSLSLLVFALVVSAGGALGLQWLTDRTSAYGDVPIAIVLSGSFAVATLLISWGRGFAPVTVDVEGFLFGSLAIVTASGARLMGVLTVCVVGVILYYYKELFFITFDERAARVAQFDADRYNTLLVVMTAVVVVGAMQILGVILVAAMLVVPAAAASQVARSFRETLYLAILIGEVSVVVGLLVSLLGRLPPGGSIVVVAIAFYLLAVVGSNRAPARLSLT